MSSELMQILPKTFLKDCNRGLLAKLPLSIDSASAFNAGSDAVVLEIDSLVRATGKRLGKISFTKLSSIGVG